MKYFWKITLWVLLAAAICSAALFWFIRPNHIETQKIDNLTIHTITKSYSDIRLIVEGDKYFLIDAGLASDAEALDEAIRDLGYNPKNISAIILSHGHHDHAGGAQYFKQKYAIPIIAGAGDVAMLKLGKNDKICPTDFMAELRYEGDQTATYPPIEVDVVIDNVAELEALAGIKGQIIPMAGHTSGSLIVTINEFVFVGDMFRGSMLGNDAVTHFYMCDINANKRDIQNLLANIVPQAKQFFMGHFGQASREKVNDLVMAQ